MYVISKLPMTVGRSHTNIPPPMAVSEKAVTVEMVPAPMKIP